jgi:hypothetical protein
MGRITQLAAVPAVAAAAVLAAGCGKSKPPSSTEWANGLCSAVTTWRSSVGTAVDSVTKGNLSQENVQSAADDVKNATSKLADDVKALGKPDTDTGDQAKKSVDDLTNELDTEVQTIEDAVGNVSGTSGALSAVSVVSSTFLTMKTQLTTTFKQLKQLDPKGELADAFKSAEACAPYRTSS